MQSMLKQLFGKSQRCDSMKYRQYLTRYKISLNLDTKFASRKWTMIRCKLHKPIRCQSYIMKTTLKKNLRITLAPTCYWIVICPHQIWNTNALPESDNHQEKARLQTTWSLEGRRKKKHTYNFVQFFLKNNKKHRIKTPWPGGCITTI